MKNLILVKLKDDSYIMSSDTQLTSVDRKKLLSIADEICEEKPSNALDALIIKAREQADIYLTFEMITAELLLEENKYE